MKKILVIVKISIVPLVALPLALNDYHGVQQNYHTTSADDPTLSQTINVSNLYLREHLLDKSAEPLENINDFYNSIPKTEVENDDYSSSTPQLKGVPQIRFGGGLFFDYRNYSTSAEKKIGNNMFGDANYASYNEQIPIEDTDSPSDHLTNKTANLTKKADDLSNLSFKGDRQNGTFGWNLQNTQTNAAEKDNIVNDRDFNLTPNTERDMKDNKVKTSPSLEKKTFTNIINKELYSWYWETWEKEYDDRALAEYNENKAKLWQQTLIRYDFANSMKLDLSLSWNQLVEKTKSINATEKYGEKVARELVKRIIGNLPIPKAYGSVWALNQMFSKLFPSSYTVYSDKTNLKNYFSPALNQTFWYNLFDQYLGTPTSKTGLIPDYYAKYKELPSDIKLNNFDFYTLLQDMDLPSTMYHKTIQGIHGYTAWSYDSYTDFRELGRNLGLQLGMNFTMSRKDTGLNNLMKELMNIPTLLDFYHNFARPHNAKKNVTEIRNLIRTYDDKLGTITPDLTFLGKIKKSGVSNLEVYYKGQDQNFSIPLKTI